MIRIIWLICKRETADIFGASEETVVSTGRFQAMRQLVLMAYAGSCCRKNHIKYQLFFNIY